MYAVGFEEDTLEDSLMDRTFFPVLIYFLERYIEIKEVRKVVYKGIPKVQIWIIARPGSAIWLSQKKGIIKKLKGLSSKRKGRTDNESEQVYFDTEWNVCKL